MLGLSSGGGSSALRLRKRDSARRRSLDKRQYATRPSPEITPNTPRNTSMLTSGVPAIASGLKVHDLADPQQADDHHAERAEQERHVVEQDLGVTTDDHH